MFKKYRCNFLSFIEMTLIQLRQNIQKKSTCLLNIKKRKFKILIQFFTNGGYRVFEKNITKRFCYICMLNCFESLKKYKALCYSILEALKNFKHWHELQNIAYNCRYDIKLLFSLIPGNVIKKLWEPWELLNEIIG